MTTAAQDLRAFILGSTGVSTLVGTKCHYNHIPQEAARPTVWFRITSDTEPRTMDGVGGIHEAFADIECAGATESSAQAVADAVKPRIDGYKGAFGTRSAKAMVLSDKDDDYVPISNGDDDGVHVIAYGLHFWFTT